MAVILVLQLAGCVSVYKPPKQSVAALDQYLSGAVRGDAQSQNSLVRALMVGGQGVGRDPLLAQRYLIAAAERGSASAQSYLAREYFGEIPAPLARDAALGSYWATRAAVQGDSEAMRALSNCHGQVDSSAFDPIESCKWLKVGYAAHAGGACDPKKLGAEPFAEAQRRAVEWRNQNPILVEKP
jgi:hypothetical protein